MTSYASEFNDQPEGVGVRHQTTRKSAPHFPLAEDRGSGYELSSLAHKNYRKARRRRTSKTRLMVANVRPHPGSGTATTRVIVSVEPELKESLVLLSLIHI